MIMEQNEMQRGQWTELRAGAVQLYYTEGELRYLRVGDSEVIRRVYVAVRDRLWRTIPLHISNFQAQIEENHFHLTFTAAHQEGEIDFAWRGTITGEASGTITFTMDGEARSTFQRNRIGICVLHPVRECAGQPCAIESPEGTMESAYFPQLIAPHQPFKNLRAITHEIHRGLRAEVRLEGDIFEMEDQRNWTDGSFKTYSTPLALPFPVAIEKGAKITQSFELRLKGETTPALIKDATPEIVTLTVGTTPIGRLPRIGLGVASHGQQLSTREIALLRALHLSHLRVDLHLHTTSYEAALRRATNEARALQVNLEIALFFSDSEEEQLRALADIVRRIDPPVATWLIFHTAEKVTSAKWIKLARQALQQPDTSAKFGGGTDYYFAELNRNCPTSEALELTDIICYSINPQVHAVDDVSLIETLEAQAATVETARQFLGNVPLAITPVTLKPRFNPDAREHVAAPDPDTLPASVDKRQMSLFAAAWTVGSLKYLAESDVESLTFYETTGWRGVMATAQESTMPELFPAPPGAGFPLYHVLADVGEFAAGEILPLQSSDPLKVIGLALRLGLQTRLLLCNVSSLTQHLIVGNLAGRAVRKNLDEESVQQAMLAPEHFRRASGEPLSLREGQLDIKLQPYEVVRLDCS